MVKNRICRNVHLLVLLEYVNQLTMHAMNNMKISECFYVIICRIWNFFVKPVITNMAM